MRREVLRCGTIIINRESAGGTGWWKETYGGSEIFNHAHCRKHYWVFYQLVGDQNAF